MEQLNAFCEKKNISLEGVLLLTVQHNRQSRFFSLVVEDGERILDSYPVQGAAKDHQHYYEGAFSVAYKAGLPKLPKPEAKSDEPSEPEAKSDDPSESDDDKSDEPEEDKKRPDDDYECCQSASFVNIPPHESKWNSVFKNFMSHRGSSDYVFEVERKIDYGPSEWIKYFELHDGKWVEVEGEFKHKEHTYCNLKCPKHKKYYAVNVYSRHAVGNKHHMRPQVVTRRNEELEKEFFDCV